MPAPRPSPTLVSALLLLGIPPRPAAAEGPRAEVTFTAIGGRMSGTAPPESRNAFDIFGIATRVSATLFFFRPLDDDATPPSLAPFLQRATTLTFSLGAAFGGWPASGIPGTDPIGPLTSELSAAIDLYFHPAVAVLASARYQLLDLINGGHVLVSAALALRFGDVRAAVGFDTSTTDDSNYAAREHLRLSSPPPGTAGLVPTVLEDPSLLVRSALPASAGSATHALLDFRAVFLEHIDLHVDALAGPGAFAASLRVAFYPPRRFGRLGLHGGGWGGGATSTSAAEDTTTFGLLLGMSYWLRPHLAAAVTWSSWWSTSDLGGLHADQLALTLAARGL